VRKKLGIGHQWGVVQNCWPFFMVRHLLRVFYEIQAAAAAAAARNVVIQLFWAVGGADF
jgi:hypothetical protein